MAEHNRKKFKHFSLVEKDELMNLVSKHGSVIQSNTTDHVNDM